MKQAVKKISKKSILVYLAVVMISVVYILVGHEIAMTSYQPFSGDDNSIVIKATVQEVTDRYMEMYEISETEFAQNETILFTAEVRSGDLKGEVVEAAQTLDYFTALNPRVVEPGDKVLLYTIPDGMAENQWLLSDYQRSDQILMLLAVFLVLVLALAGGRALIPLYR